MIEKRKVKKHILIMSIIGIFFSALICLSSGPKEIIAIMGIEPLLCILAFLITKHPLFGILYTISFALPRISLFIGGTLLAVIGIALLIFYFIYVDVLSYQYYIQVKRDKKIKKLTEE